MNTFPIEKVRSQLFLDNPFYGSLAMHLEMVENPSIPTLRTDGVTLEYNPEYMASLTSPERLGVMAHEVGHCALRHLWRRNGREPREWNEAADFVLNADLIKAGFTLPDGILHDPQFDGMYAEQVYSKRRSMNPPPPPEPEPEPEPQSSDDQKDSEEEETEQDQTVDNGDDSEDEQPGSDDEDGDEDGEGDPQDGDSDSGEPGSDEEGDGDDEPGGGEGSGDEDSDGNGSGDGDESEDGTGEAGEGEGQGSKSIMGNCPTGEFLDGADAEEGDDTMTEHDWEIATEQAVMVAKAAGHMPGGLARLIEQSREPEVDWKAELRDFVTSALPDGQTWCNPNRRFVSWPLYLPGSLKESVGVMVVVIDVSGSITKDQLDDAGSELTGVLHDARPEKMIILSVDTEVRGVQEFTPDDPEVKIQMVGGGGTEFEPAFRWVEENNIDPIGLIYFTDLYGPTPEQPSYPVLWITPRHSFKTEPFGRLVRLP